MKIDRIILIFLDIVLGLLVKNLFWKVKDFEYFYYVYSFVRDCKICVEWLLENNGLVY